MKIAFETLGCRTNFLDSSSMAQDFMEAGWEIVTPDTPAEVYIINSCTVTHQGDSDSRAAVNRLRRNNKNAKIILTGCYAQVSPEECAQLEGVDIIAGNLEKHDLLNILQQEKKNYSHKSARELSPHVYVQDILQEKDFYNKPIYSSLGRTRANLKVQDGCNYRCSFCIIPYARGNSRSNTIENTLHQVEDLVKAGYQEIILTGIHLGQFGRDHKNKTSLATLLQEIEKVNGLERYRLSSIGPMEITDDLIETVANSSKFCRHLHISLQSGSNEILRAMHRPYSVEEYAQIIHKVSNVIPNLAIGSDIIVGFPGETQEQFMETYRMVESLPITYVHVFTYSERQETKAVSLDHKVDPKIKKERNKTLTTLATKKKLDFYRQFIGQNLQVLVENSRDKKTGLLKGLSDNYIKVLFEGDDSLTNTILPVKINDIEYNSVIGEQVSSLGND